MRERKREGLRGQEGKERGKGKYWEKLGKRETEKPSALCIKQLKIMPAKNLNGH